MKYLLAQAIKEKMKQNGITYEGLSVKADVSKTYLTDITGKGKIPTAGIIEKIASALDVDPENIKEYRIIKIQDNLERFYQFYSQGEVIKIEKAVMPKEAPAILDDNGIRFPSREYKQMENTDWLDLSGLRKEDRKVILDLFERFKPNTKRNN